MARRRAATALVGFAILVAPVVSIAQQPGLVLERTIDLGKVVGRIDHLAIDLARKRLFVAELGNGSVDAVDLETGRVFRRIGGLREPQGIGVAPDGTVAVASAGDGSVRLFKADDLSPTATVELGEDADNIRLDEAGRLVVGYGSGGLATLDPATGRKVADIPLPAHPEGFQIDPKQDRIYVNLPTHHQVAVVERSSGKRIANWGLWLAAGNFPMALDGSGGRLFAAYRWPGTIASIDTGSGDVVGKASVCGDADDIFYDAARRRLYASCGGGSIAILDARSGLAEASQIPTRKGARTSLFVPVLDRLFLAVPAAGELSAEIRVYAPR